MALQKSAPKNPKIEPGFKSKKVLKKNSPPTSVYNDSKNILKN
jgi:hypothetical protein